MLAIFFSASVEQLLQLLPAAVLGAILFLTGVQLALGGLPSRVSKAQALVTLATAGMALWNVAMVFGVGLLLWHLARRLSGRCRIPSARPAAPPVYHVSRR